MGIFSGVSRQCGTGAALSSHAKTRPSPILPPFAHEIHNLLDFGKLFRHGQTNKTKLEINSHCIKQE